ncbi:hypothetical protein [Providencia alcalifaciens]|uniref:hypothetical protein n=1 Tax=Providencia alcalifaciens TaxID=126385 RepID=UPI00029C72CD|nr:hypothetical protein [Providencia alcalifaciens]EKT66274.1 hypothetical protein OO9_06937 [Providencia alcalifaciens Dmel2]
MKRILAVAAVVVLLAGCGEQSASEKVMEFIKTENLDLLSKSSIAKCTTTGIKNIHFVDKNELPTTNDYYKLSKFLYDKSKYSVVSEESIGDATKVKVKWTYPKAIDDADFFLEAENPAISERTKKDLDNLNELYLSGDLDNLEYEEFIKEWVVLPDGIDPQLSKGQLEICSS